MLCFSNKVCNTSLHQPIPDEMKQKKKQFLEKMEVLNFNSVQFRRYWIVVFIYKKEYPDISLKSLKRCF